MEDADIKVEEDVPDMPGDAVVKIEEDIPGMPAGAVVHEEIAFKLCIHGVHGPGFPRVTAHPCQRSKCGTKGHWNGQHQGQRATSQRERRGEGHPEV